MNKISNQLKKWYLKNNYNFPWREQVNPYRVWISEIMLQQTQVKTAIPYYNKWMTSFKTVEKVALSHIDKILKQWEGLGYYQRAHNIHTTSQVIVKTFNSSIPDDYNELIKLNGIGDYTASAILSIAYNKKYPAIDGNLKRVISRVVGISNSKKIVFKSKQFVMNLMCDNEPGIINQSLMDLGREVCISKNPKCLICPISEFCMAYKKNKISYYSQRNPVKVKPIYNVSVGIIWKKNKILISKRKKNGLLGGLWELPGGKKRNSEMDIPCLHREVDEEIGIQIKVKEKIGHIKHHYSHFGIYLTGFYCYYLSGKAQAKTADDIKWIKPSEIINYPFPKATLKLFVLAGLLYE